MRETRPNPQEILKEINKNEKESKRGKLKIFFGYVCWGWENICNVRSDSFSNCYGVRCCNCILSLIQDQKP